MTLFPRSPFRGARRVIDVSGDGANNRGRPVTLARDEAVAAGVGINGLPILALEPDLDRYYQDFVIGGPGAFVVVARDYETFGEAILKKLITEIAAPNGTGARPHERADAGAWGATGGGKIIAQREAVRTRFVLWSSPACASVGHRVRLGGRSSCTVCCSRD